MLADIATLVIMIEDSLQYLSSTGVTEQLRKVDVSSLLQTITSGFCDLGYAVTFKALNGSAMCVSRRRLYALSSTLWRMR